MSMTEHFFRRHSGENATNLQAENAKLFLGGEIIVPKGNKKIKL